MLRHLLGNADRFVVLDVETTGLHNKDRVVEIAVVTLDRNGEAVDEWDTLVDPQRDVGPVYIHGITASMVSAAPRFEEIAGTVARRLDGAVLVAHNLAFDARMVRKEFDRASASFSSGSGVCTLQLTGEKLSDACRRYKIEHVSHRALGDARASARLLSCVAKAPITTRPAFAACPSVLRAASRTLRRDHFKDCMEPMPYLARLATQLHHFGEHGPTLAYLDMLDWALADLVITPEEADELTQLAEDLGLDASNVANAHRRYIEELAAAAARDEIITDGERDVLLKTALALGVDARKMTSLLEDWSPKGDTLRLYPGLRVCFTGTATYPDGTELSRARLEDLAVDLGCVAVDSVTKKHCDLVVAADPMSQSGKAAKARRFGIPIASVADFLKVQHEGSLPVLALG